MTAELLWLMVAADPTAGNPTEIACNNSEAFGDEVATMLHSLHFSQSNDSQFNFEMSHRKGRLSDLIATSDSSTAERAAILIFLPRGQPFLVCWFVG